MLEQVALRVAQIRRADEMTPAEWESYRKKHPKADPSKHKIVKPDAPKAPQEAPTAPEGKRKSPDAPKSQGKNQPLPLPDKSKSKAVPAKEPKSEGEHKGDRAQSWKTRLKGLKESATKFVSNAPKAVKFFLGDPDFRRATLKEAKDSITSMPKKTINRLVNTVKEEVHEFKEAGAGIKAVMSGKKMSEHQKHAFKTVATHLAIGAAAAAFAATGPLSGAAVFSKNMAVHVAMKSVKRALGSLHTLNEISHIGHGVMHLIEHVASEQEPDPEEAMTNLVLASVAKQIEQLTDEDFIEVLNNLDESAGAENKPAALRVLSRYRGVV